MLKNLKLKEPGDGMGAKFFCDQIVAGKTTYKNHTTILGACRKHFHETCGRNVGRALLSMSPE
jgi:hypothetical protein